MGLSVEVAPALVMSAEFLRQLADAVEAGEYGSIALLAITMRDSRGISPSVVCWGRKDKFTAGDVEDLLHDGAEQMKQASAEEDEMEMEG